MNQIKQGTNLLGVILGFTQKYKSQKISNIALDGTPYVQSTGQASEKRKSHVYCDTPQKRIGMDSASNNGALLTATWKGTTYRGYIDGDISWNEWNDGHGVGEFDFMVKEVIT